LYAGRLLHVQAPALVLYNALVPYTCQQHEALVGYCCLFTTEFVSEARRGGLAESPLFRLDAEPVFRLSPEQAAHFSQQFDQLIAALPTDPRYLAELLRTKVQLLVLEALRLRLDAPTPLPGGATARLATQFLELLAQQFPILTPTQPLRLTTASQFAERLHTHANHLNRAVREATGQPIRVHVAARVLQEAQTLLRFTSWPVGDIARSLGFEAATSLQRFFRRHMQLTPRNFRLQYEARISAGELLPAANKAPLSIHNTRPG
jgi:AraC family transcriptional activator of pobA